MALLKGFIGQEIWYFKAVPRAMTIAKKLLKKYPRSAHGRIIVAERVIEAKGRFYRRWFAEAGGLWLALTLYDELLPETGNLLSLLFGLAMVKTCHDLGAKEVKLRWISDPHLKGRKLGGVLIERYKDWFLVGLGLNINNTPPRELPALSLKQLLGKEIPLLLALSKLIIWINYYYEGLLSYDRALLTEEEGTCPLISDFYLLSDTIGRCVAFSYDLDSEDYLIGKVLDLAKSGAIIIMVEDKVYEFNSGELIYL